jgi:hypothetical protein
MFLRRNSDNSDKHSGLAREAKFLTGLLFAKSVTAISASFPLKVRGKSETKKMACGTCRGEDLDRMCALTRDVNSSPVLVEIRKSTIRWSSSYGCATASAPEISDTSSSAE